MSITVGDLLKSKGYGVETITTPESILVAIQRMSSKHIGCLAVVSDGGALIGILSERDCLWKIVAEGKSPADHIVQETMTPLEQMRTVTPSIAVEECMELMSGRRHRHLPVLEEGKLIGMISIGDVVKALIDSQKAMISSLEKYITGTY
ncbi:MAG: CBS domain-containing protein [Lentisphaerae bacterium]|jgi:CBS domain-containing protein|nr:CBS domain-containing protein [Lentisphaerota bacterium]